MTWVSTADAVARETTWLTASGDGLPALLAADGGPWDVVQAYVPRSPNASRRQIYVARARVEQPRTSNQRLMTKHHFRLRAIWPMRSGAGEAEAEQAAFDVGLDLLLQRIWGGLYDHTHGGRFLSVAENPRTVEVELDAVEQTAPQIGAFLAAISYTADDTETIG